MKASSNSLFTMLGILPVLIWGISLPIVKLSVEQFGTWWTLPLFNTGAVALFPLIVFFKPGSMRSLGSRQVLWRLGVRVSLFISFFTALFYSLMKVDRSLVPAVIFLNYLWPTLTLWFGLLLTPQPYSRKLLLLGSIGVFFALFCEFILNSLVFGHLASDSTHLLDALPYLLLTLAAANLWALNTALQTDGDREVAVLLRYQ